MKIIHAIPALMLAAAVSCSKPIQQTADYNVVPLPQEITPAEGPGFLLSSKTVIAYPADNDTLKRNAELMAEYFKTLTDNDLKLVTEAPEKDAVVLKDDLDSSNPEAYQITVNSDLITINGASAAGNFYGIQTLRKAVPSKAHQNVEYPAVTINDAPRFGYRGAMFDVARHFFPVDSVKQFIDMLALHNVNTLHWHLSDDQGWRIEIKKRPGLTEIGSKRSGTCIGHNFDTNDSIPYGGFYTQEEAKEIVKYAADRHITVIPEIDLPGHMLGALSAYPELGCTGGPYEVWTRWGVADDVLCAGNDSTYQLIDDVLTEITEVFPSKYIHIGGDESPKVRWEKCPKCQAKIKELGLKSDAHSTAEQKLQTYVMDRATKTLNKLGRNMIGWDEVLEGGPVEGGVIMSWRGTEGAVTAVKSGMKAILSPTNYCYFDYTQALDKENEPLGIGGYLPVEKVYSFEPIDPTLTEDEKSRVLGAQGNLWTEYISTMDHVFYNELPRMAALAEVGWTAPEKKDFRQFTGRMANMFHQYDAFGFNYARHLFNVQPQVTIEKGKGIVVNLSTFDNAPIYYTLDGTEPTEAAQLYTEPVVLDKTCTIKAAVIRPEGKSPVWADSVSFNKATSAEVTFEFPPHSRYTADGPQTLVDGRFGRDAFNDGSWIGFNSTPMVATLDLGQPKEISSLSVNTNVRTNDWIYDTRKISVEVSDNGKDFKEVASQDYPALTSHKSEIVNHTLTFAPVKEQWVRITMVPEKSIGSFHDVAAGQGAFIFVDEIVLN